MKVTIDASPVDENEKDDKVPDEWEIRSAVDCLIRAEEIKGNKKLMPLVAKELQERKDAIAKVPTSIADLKKLAKQKESEDSEDSDADEEGLDD